MYAKRSPIKEFHLKRKVKCWREPNLVGLPCVVGKKCVDIGTPMYVTFFILLCASRFDLAKARAANTYPVAATDIGTTLTATTSHANHKQHHRSTLQYAHNNFTYLQERSAADFIPEKGDASAGNSMPDVAVTLPARSPDARTNAGEFD